MAPAATIEPASNATLLSKSALQSSKDREVNDVFVLRKQGEFFYEQRPVPTLPSSKHVLLKILATGICGSDVHYWRHGGIGDFIVRQPLVLGHESAGVVVQCGEDVTSLSVGDRVAVEPGVPCRSCNFCRHGKYNLCDEMKFAATPPVDGTLATFYTAPEDFCYRLPAHASIEEGALIEPLSIAVHVVKLASVTTGQSVIVMGAGPIGLLCCAVARAFGASTVVVTDIVDSRLDFAKSYAATHTYKMEQISADENAKNIKRVSGLVAGADIVIDATGVQSCISSGIHAMKRGATFVQAGLGKPNIDFPVGQICFKEGVFKGSFRYGPGDYEVAVELLRSQKIDLKRLVSQTYPFSQAEQAFEGVLRQEGIKTIIYGP